jgi:putative PEP-CTERM system TPR-repeat lipoprotein
MQNLNKALSVKPDSLEAQRAIMMLDLEAGKTDAALTVARNVQKQRPKESAGYVLEGDVYALKKSWPEAISAYKNGIKQSGATELAIKTHAALNSSGKSSEADGFADGWLKEHAKDMQFRLYLAESATARKDFATASKLYKILVDVQPDNALLLNNLAWSLAQNKDPKAVDYAEKAYKLAPEQAAIADTLGGLLVDKGDTARGIELLQKAVSLAPQNPPIRLNYAKALAKAGKKDEAKKELEELSKLGDKFADQNEVSKLLQSL